jgi:hypothetical protein
MSSGESVPNWREKGLSGRKTNEKPEMEKQATGLDASKAWPPLRSRTNPAAGQRKPMKTDFNGENQETSRKLKILLGKRKSFSSNMLARRALTATRIKIKRGRVNNTHKIQKSIFPLQIKQDYNRSIEVIVFPPSFDYWKSRTSSWHTSNIGIMKMKLEKWKGAPSLYGPI